MTSWWDKKKKTRALVLALCLSMGTGVAGATDKTIGAGKTETTVTTEDSKVKYTAGNTTEKLADVDENRPKNDPRATVTDNVTFESANTTITNARLSNEGEMTFRGEKVQIKEETYTDTTNALTNRGMLTFENTETEMTGDFVNYGTTKLNGDKTTINGEVVNSISANPGFNNDGVLEFNSKETKITGTVANYKPNAKMTFNSDTTTLDGAIQNLRKAM